MRLRAFLSGRGSDQTRSQQMQALFSARGRSRQTTGYGDGIVPSRGRGRDPIRSHSCRRQWRARPRSPKAAMRWSRNSSCMMKK